MHLLMLEGTPSSSTSRMEVEAMYVAELELSNFADGSVPLATQQLPEFVEIAERAQLCSVLV